MQKVNADTLHKSTKGLILFNAVVWLSFGIASLFLAFEGMDANVNYRWILGGLMIINACVMLWLGWKLEVSNNFLFYFAVAYTTVNAVLSITDQMGIIDFVILLLNLSILGMLFITRTRQRQAA